MSGLCKVTFEALGGIGGRLDPILNCGQDPTETRDILSLGVSAGASVETLDVETTARDLCAVCRHNPALNVQIIPVQN